MTNTIETGELVEAQYDWSTKSPSIAIIEAIAAVENMEVAEVPVTLHDHVDPEGLDALVTGESDVLFRSP